MNGYRWQGQPRYRVHEEFDAPTPDAPGYDLKPNPDAVTSPADLTAALRKLHIWAGEPSFRELSRRCGGLPSHGTFRNLLHAEALPDFALLSVFVDALGLPEDRDLWLNAWRRIRMTDTP